MTNVRTRMPATGHALPFHETGFQRIRSFARHRCDLRAEGFACEEGDRPYDYDSRTRRDGCLFQYTLSGEGCFQLLPGGKTQLLTAGQGFLVPLPSPTRYWLAAGRIWEFCYLLLDGEMAYDLVRQLNAQHGYLWEMPPESLPVTLIRSLHRRVHNGDIPDEFESATLAHQFLMELFRWHHRPKRAPTPVLAAALTRIEQEYRSHALSVAQLAADAGYSRFHFARLFRRETGQNPHAYLQRYRIRRAMELLVSTNNPVKQVALESGFSDCAYFCKEFKRWTHHTPATVRTLKLDQIHIS